MSGYGDFKSRRPDGVWHFLNRLVITMIAFALLTVVVCAFLPELRKQREQASRLEELQEQISKQRLALNRRTREVDLLNHEPAYVEIIARDRLDLMKEGETVFRLDPPGPDTSNFRLRKQ